MSKPELILLTDLIYQSQTKYCISEIQMMTSIFLFFVTRKITFRDISDKLGIPTSSIRNNIKNIIKILLSIRKDWIKLPSINEMKGISIGFGQKSNIHGTILAIDGTHIPIYKPKINGNRYYNRKNFTSINLLMGCDNCNNIRYFFGCAFGSSHDAFIFNNSYLKHWIQNIVPDGYHVIADSAYPNSSKIITPKKNPQTDEDSSYNKKISKQRIEIERTFGLFKQKFGRFKYPLYNGESEFSLQVLTCSIIIYNILNKKE